MTWPQVALVLGLTALVLSAVTILALNHADVAAIMGAVGTVVVLVAGVFGYHINSTLSRGNDTTNEVKVQSNGRMSDVLEQNQDLQRQLTALALLVTPPPSPSEGK